jgi:hypothetical protein
MLENALALFVLLPCLSVIALPQLSSLRKIPAAPAFALLHQPQTQQQTQQQSPNPPDPHSIPSLDGGAGPCTADLTITDNAGAPIYNALVKVHIAYGTLSLHKLDLQISTNVDGKVRFTGLPDRLKHGLLFRASEGNRSGEAFDDPANTCKAQFTVALLKK